VTNKKNYAELVTQAEKAVGSVQDPELRRVAFQKVLDDLLGSASQEGEASRHKIEAPAANSSARKTRPRKVTKGGTQTYIDELLSGGFFKKPKTISQLKAELENRGHHIPLTSLSGPLQRMCQHRTLRRHRVKAGGKRETFAYSNW